MKKISVVIPVFNNRETVGETLQRIINLHENKLETFALEVVFIDDGSSDGSWDELLRIQSLKPRIVSLAKLSRNFGQVYAILAGYELSTGDAVITISADLQDPISLIDEMVAKWNEGNEVVIAHRAARNDDVSASLFSKIAYGIARKANPNIPPGGFDYLLMSRRVIDLLKCFEGRHRFFQGDVLWAGLPTAFIPYVRERRPYGKSGWTFSRKFKYFIDLLIDSSYLPVRAMSVLGISTAFAGFVYAGVIVLSWFMRGTPFQGWAPLMIITLVIGGAIMTMLGVIGEYMWRLYDDIKKRPLYVFHQVKSTLDYKGLENE